MNKEDLKKKACQAIDQYAEEIHAFAEDIYRNPELGFKEFRTTDKTAEFLEKLDLEVEKDLAITGCKSLLDTGKSGPRVAILGELDSVITHDHKDAAEEDGACHTCGHNIQLAAMLGSALGLIKSGALDHLSGSVEFMAVPAEEFIEIDYRSKLIEEGKLKYAGGKQELVYRGHFDQIDMGMIMHVESFQTEKKASLKSKSNGFIGKKVNFIGREAHSGATPHLGINALNAASLSLNNINALRETFRDEDHIRVHPIITKGGDIVNVVPADVQMESYVRGASIEAIQAANHKVNNCLKAGALATGAQVEIQEIPGYLPLLSHDNLYEAYKENLLHFLKEEEIQEGVAMAGSTDTGDLTHLFPMIHPMSGGTIGALHTRDYQVVDRDLAYIIPAKVFVMTLIDLLYDKAQLAKEILKDFKPAMTKEQYLEFLEENSSKEIFSYD